MKKVKAFFVGVFTFAKWLLVPVAIWAIMKLVVWAITLFGMLFIF